MLNNQQLLELADQYGTPLYVYDLETVRAQARKFKDAIGIDNMKLLYAVKIQYNPEIAKVMKEEGFGIDAVSLEEIEYVLRLGFDPKDILYTGNNMTDHEMQRAHDLGVMLNIGAISRLEKFGKYAPGSAVCIRINPDVEAVTHEHWVTGGELSKFGTSYKQIPKILKVAAKYDLKIVGIHEHIGTSILQWEDMITAMEVLLKEVDKFPDLQFVNFGGGIGIKYKPDDRDIDIEQFGGEARRVFQKYSDKNITFMMEPGRYFVADAGHLLVEVNTLKTSPEGRTFAGVNSGYHHLIRPMTYGSYHPISNVSNADGELKKYDVAGNICESGDLFARDRMIQEIREYDILDIEKSGSSGFAMANNYHLRPLPPEIIVDGEEVRVSRQRQKLDDLLSPYGL